MKIVVRYMMMYLLGQPEKTREAPAKKEIPVENKVSDFGDGWSDDNWEALDVSMLQFVY